MDVAALHARGKDAWPDVELSVEALAAHLGDRVVTAERAADVYLACACALGDARAIARFEAALFDDARAAIARIARDPGAADEALQLLRHRLFVSDGKALGIANYSGRGELRSWLRVSATRIALGMLRGRRHVAAGDGELARIAAGDGDPELALLRKRYATEANAALAAAFGELEVRDRNLLRQYYVDDLSIDALGQLYGVHRATAARWLDAARDRLEQRTRRRLVEQLGVSDDTADSIVAMMRSELHLSLSGEEPAAGDRQPATGNAEEQATGDRQPATGNAGGGGEG